MTKFLERLCAAIAEVLVTISIAIESDCVTRAVTKIDIVGEVEMVVLSVDKGGVFVVAAVEVFFLIVLNWRGVAINWCLVWSWREVCEWEFVDSLGIAVSARYL